MYWRLTSLDITSDDQR